MTVMQQVGTEFPCGKTAFLLPGPAGHLEILTSTPAGAKDSLHSVVGVVCHPHPLYGGTLDNKVVSTVARVFNDLGCLALCFNFRGVGASTGTYANGVGETEDLLAVLQWLKQIGPQYKVCLAGFSFGAYVAACASKNWPVQSLILLAPPVERFNFRELTLFSGPLVVIQGEADEIVAPTAVFSWLDSLDPPPILIRLSGAGHFFHGKLIDLRQVLTHTLESDILSIVRQ